jgi:urease subunit alpha
VTQTALDCGLADKLKLRKQLLPVKNTRALSKADMLHNNACPEIEVDPDTFQVRVNGEIATCEPVSRVPLGRLYIFR